MRWILWALTGMAVVYVGTCALLFWVQRSLIYMPTPAADVPGLDVLWLDSDGEQLKIWRVSPSSQTATGPGIAVIYFGGNAEDVSHNAGWLSAELPSATLYLANYRGYGGSSGSPGEQALYQDAERLYDRVAASHSGVAVIGRSLGAGVATHLATRRSLERLVLVTPFDSLARVAGNHFPLFPARLLIRDRYDSFARAGRIDIPTLLVIAERDEVISLSHSRRLISALPSENLETVSIPGAGHNDLGPAYPEALGRFLRGKSEEYPRLGPG